MLLNNTPIPSTELTVSIVTEFDSEELSGETSSTNSAYKGIKPKSVNVSFLVKRLDANLLTSFYRLAEATDDSGDLVVYSITDRSANAANIRQVKFSGRIDQREIPSLKGWRVSFRLKEHLSVAEKTEYRRAENVSGNRDPLQESQPQTGFEQVLHNVEKSLP